jgi:hypothetical protein
MKKLILFLDVDGVLNNYSWASDYLMENGYSPFRDDILCPLNLTNFVFLFNQIKRNYEIKVVLSSSWRWYEDTYSSLTKQLAPFNITIDDTTDKEINKTLSREDEIERYLESHPLNIEDKILILDDEPMRRLTDHHIWTSLACGLTMEMVEEALVKLNGSK